MTVGELFAGDRASRRRSRSRRHLVVRLPAHQPAVDGRRRSRGAINERETDLPRRTAGRRSCCRTTTSRGTRRAGRLGRHRRPATRSREAGRRPAPHAPRHAVPLLRRGDRRCATSRSRRTRSSTRPRGGRWPGPSPLVEPRRLPLADAVDAADRATAFSAGRPWLRIGDDADRRNVAAQDRRPAAPSWRLPPADLRCGASSRRSRSAATEVASARSTSWPSRARRRRIGARRRGNFADDAARTTGRAGRHLLDRWSVRTSTRRAPTDAASPWRSRPFEAVVLRDRDRGGRIRAPCYDAASTEPSPSGRPPCPLIS